MSLHPRNPKATLKRRRLTPSNIGIFHGKITKKTLWGGRFSTSLTTETIAFTHSVEADTRLIGYDIWGSQAHAIMLTLGKALSLMPICARFYTWLRKAETDFQNGDFTLDPNKEDVHMNVESYLIENAGREFGGKLHTARSRNDQVLVDAHLYIRDEILNVQRGVSELCEGVPPDCQAAR